MYGSAMCTGIVVASLLHHFIETWSITAPEPDAKLPTHDFRDLIFIASQIGIMIDLDTMGRGGHNHNNPVHTSHRHSAQMPGMLVLPIQPPTSSPETIHAPIMYSDDRHQSRVWANNTPHSQDLCTNMWASHNVQQCSKQTWNVASHAYTYMKRL